MTTLASILAGVTIFLGGGARYTSHVGEFNGQTWFRWCYSGDPSNAEDCDTYYDVMYIDQFGDLRYYSTVTPGGTLVYLDSVSYGAVDPHPTETEEVSGTSRALLTDADGREWEGDVAYTTTTQRSGGLIHLASTHIVTFDDEDGQAPDPDYIESWVFDDRGPVRTMGPGWALRRDDDSSD